MVKKTTQSISRRDTAPSDLAFGLSRIHEVYREQEVHTSRVFRSKKDALTWLHKEPQSET